MPLKSLAWMVAGAWMTCLPCAHILRTGDQDNVTARDAGTQKQKDAGEHDQAVLERERERMLGSLTDKKESGSSCCGSAG